ncbi:MAG TPA: hypothetical protein DCQ84_12255 [Candidatus Competibacteraceae bacterium]|nr:YbjN domain-containing protein [Candidatus Competibacteraceae bacterium]HAO33708.1 hypothetical protein [Candidatus Competibacteraceae bacterium]
MTPLQRLASQLNASDYVTHRHVVSLEPPVEKLYVALGSDEQQRDWILTLTYTSDVAAAFGVETGAAEPVYLQAFLALPVMVPYERLAEAARLILHLNRLLPAGAFGLSDPEGAVYFQLSQAADTHELSAAMIQELVALAAFYGREFGARIEALARGVNSRVEIIADLEAAGIALHDLLPQAGVARH